MKHLGSKGFKVKGFGGLGAQSCWVPKDNLGLKKGAHFDPKP